MKRLREEEIVQLNEDIFTAVLPFYEPESLGEILSFCLVNKQTMQHIDQILFPWIDSLCLRMTQLTKENEGEKKFKEASVLSMYLFQKNSSSRALCVNWFVEKDRPSGPTRNYLLGFLEMAKDAFWTWNLLSKSSITTIDHFIPQKVKLGNLYRFDVTKRMVEAVIQLTGLEVVKFPSPGKMVYTIEQIISKNVLEPIRAMASEGFKSYQSDMPYLYSTYCELCQQFGHPLEKEKPFMDASVRDLVLEGKYFWKSRKDFVFYECDRIPEGKNVTKEELVLLRATAVPRFKAIASVLGLEKDSEKRSIDIARLWDYMDLVVQQRRCW